MSRSAGTRSYPSRVEELLAGMRPERARAVRAVLVRIGVLET